MARGGCPYCSSTNSIIWHDSGVCPRVRALEYYANGTIRRVEFHADSQDIPEAVSQGDTRDLLE